MSKSEVATQPPAPLTPMDLVSRALSSGASMETLERMIVLQREYEANEARKAFEEAMAEAAKEMPVINKNATVGFDASKAGGAKTQYKHADLAEVVQSVTPVLGKHGLYPRFETSAEPGKPITVTCRISHKQGHSITNSITAQHDTSGNKNSIQAMGSTITYLSRYTLMAILGLAAARDDDGTSHREPVAGPDVLNRPTPAPAAAAPPTTAASAPAGRTSTASGSASPAPTGARLTITQVQDLEKEARLAADMGTDAFRELWKRCTSLQERSVLEGLGTELRQRMAKADQANQALAAESISVKIDPETGEIIDHQT